MAKTITLAFWAGGGVWGLSQLINAKHIVDSTQIHLNDIIDIHAAGSIGNIPALVTAMKKPYQVAQENFIKCANDMLDGSLRNAQLKRSIEHSLHHFNKDSRLKRAIFRDQSGLLHLKHSILEDFLETSFGDTKLQELDTAFVSFAHHMETNDRICFAHMGNQGKFDASKWSVVPNHGDGAKLVDIAMASTAAPTVFGPHEIEEKGHYIDCAALCSPLPVVKNIFRTVADPENTHVNILLFGTGITVNDAWDAQQYRNHGLLHMLRNWTHSMSLGNIKQDMRELKSDYGNRVDCHVIDTILPQSYKGMPFVQDSFNGSVANMDAVKDITQQNLSHMGGYFASVVEKIAEQREKEKAVDPLTILQPPSMYARYIAPLLRGGASAHSPAVSKPN